MTLLMFLAGVTAKTLHLIGTFVRSQNEGLEHKKAVKSDIKKDKRGSVSYDDKRKSRL